MSSPRHILCLNSGSSSLKLALHRGDAPPERALVEGAVERIGLADGRLWLRDAQGRRLSDTDGDFADHAQALECLFGALREHTGSEVDAVGHRVVHGGATRDAPERVDAALVKALRGLVPLAPLHLPAAIAAIEAVARQRPELPQVACYDTAFHRRLPELAQRLPLPRDLYDEGVRRYGFHGLSYEFVVEALGPALRARTVVAHLGNGASLVALRDGQPVDTTMGLTPTGGVVMGTRSGDLDPGVLVYLARARGWDADRLERLVDAESGLLGVSGSSSDMRTLLERRARDASAAQAVALFAYSVRKAIGALAAVLGGLDLLVFTGGIGERAGAVREEICADLAHLGVRLVPGRSGGLLSEPGSACEVRVIETDENRVIARHVRRVLGWA